MLVLTLWLAALLCLPLHVGATMASEHGHADCVAACCAHPGAVGDVSAVPPTPSFGPPEPVLRHLCAVDAPPVQTPPAGPAPLSRGRPPDLQVFLI